MRAFIICVAALVAVGGIHANAQSASCDDDSLKSKTDDGEILVTLSGHVYQVIGGDQITSALWLPVSELMICAQRMSVQGKNMIYYEIINTDDKEKVGATLLR